MCSGVFRWGVQNGSCFTSNTGHSCSSLGSEALQILPLCFQMLSLQLDIFAFLCIYNCGLKINYVFFAVFCFSP